MDAAATSAQILLQSERRRATVTTTIETPFTRLFSRSVLSLAEANGGMRLFL